MPAAVVCSDLHLDHVTYGVPRFKEGREVLRASCEHAVRVRAAAWMFLGDLCDPDSGSSVFRCVREILSAASWLSARGIPSVFLAGNHDVIEDGSGETTLTPLHALDASHRFVHVVESPDVVRLPDLPDIVCFPFTASSHPYDPREWALAQVERATKSKCMTISHLAVPGVQPGEETTELPRGREVVFPIAETEKAVARLQGHYHRGQDFYPKGSREPIHIVGSACRLTFGEEHNEPGYLVLNV